jgi:hypothetical protein
VPHAQAVEDKIELLEGRSISSSMGSTSGSARTPGFVRRTPAAPGTICRCIVVGAHHNDYGPQSSTLHGGCAELVVKPLDPQLGRSRTLPAGALDGRRLARC